MTQKRTKTNKEMYDLGRKSLLPSQIEWKKRKQISSIQEMGEVEKNKAQSLLNERLKVKTNGSRNG